MGWPFSSPFFSVGLVGWLRWLVISKKQKTAEDIQTGYFIQ